MNEYDSPNFAEYIYDIKNEGKIKLWRTLAVIGYIAFGLAYFVVACSIPLYPIIAILPLLVWMLVFFTWGFVSYDCYYEFRHGEMEFGTVRTGKQGRRRRPKLTVNVKGARAARVFDPADPELSSVQKTYDFSESISSDKRIIIFFDEGGVPSAVIFEGTSRVAKLISSYCEGGASLKGEVLHG